MDSEIAKVPEERVPLFENRHLRDQAFFKDFFRATLLKRKSMLVMLAIVLLSSVVNLFSWILTSSAPALIFAVAFPILAAFVYLYPYIKSVRVMTEREAELRSGDPKPYITQCFKEEIRFLTPHGGDATVEYAKIKRVKATGNYLLLGTATRQYFPIKKTGFTTGTYEDFCAFLRAKGYSFKAD